MGCTRGCRSSSSVWAGLPPSLEARGRGGRAARAGARVVRERVRLRRPLFFIVILVSVSASARRIVVRRSYQYANRRDSVSHRWGWFIWAHKQPNNFGVAMHAARRSGSPWARCCACLGSGTGRRAGRRVLRLRGLRVLRGADGPDADGRARRTSTSVPTSVIWHILPCCWLLAYVRLFLARARRRTATAPVATLDDEAPGIDPDDNRPRGSIMLCGRS